MRRRKGFRAVVRWACTALAILIFAAWALGGWYKLALRWTVVDTTSSVEVAAGRVSWIRQSPSFRSPSVQLIRLFRWYGWRWLFEAGGVTTPGITMNHYSAPLWPAFLATAAPAFLLWRARHRAARIGPGDCPSCGYDRRGLARAACPECGKSPAG
jgi:hypothetical protein